MAGTIYTRTVPTTKLSPLAHDNDHKVVVQQKINYITI